MNLTVWQRTTLKHYGFVDVRAPQGGLWRVWDPKRMPHEHPAKFTVWNWSEGYKWRTYATYLYPPRTEDGLNYVKAGMSGVISTIRYGQSGSFGNCSSYTYMPVKVPRVRRSTSLEHWRDLHGYPG